MTLRGPDCEPVHTCAPRLLLQIIALEDFRGQQQDAAGTSYFEPGGVFFGNPQIGSPAPYFDLVRPISTSRRNKIIASLRGRGRGRGRGRY